MFGSHRIGLQSLAELCYRLGVAHGSGVDLRTNWAREARGARGSAQRVLTQVSEAVDRGRSVSAALAATGDFFPVLFRDMVAVGEESGHLAEVLRQLSDHYKHQLRLRKIFREAITWPMAQLVIALSVVGLLIWIMGVIASPTGGRPTDILGFGLVGTPGLIRYILFLGLVAAGIFALYRAIRGGLIDGARAQCAILRVPLLGHSLDTLALAKLAWSLHLTLGAGMDLRRSLALSLASTQNVRYTSQIEPIWASIRGGDNLHGAFTRTGVYPFDFLDAVEVGEQSGRLVESLASLSDRYQEESRGAMQMLTTIAGYVVWALVAGLIVFLIFRIAGFYIGAINSASKM